jgi:hypothetical protein
MSNRWTKEEKKKLIKLFSNGKDFDYIGNKLGRSANAIKLRIENIVYDNIVKGIDKSVISKEMNIDNEKIIQMFYSYKSFLEKKGIDTKEASKIDIMKDSSKNKLIIDKPLRKKHNIDSIKEENKIMEEIIKNYNMKKEISKLVKSGKLSKEVIKILKNIYNE